MAVVERIKAGGQGTDSNESQIDDRSWTNVEGDLMKQEIPRTKPVSQLIITVRIVPGKAGEQQKRLMRAFWTHLIAECKDELQAKSEAKHE